MCSPQLSWTDLSTSAPCKAAAAASLMPPSRLLYATVTTALRLLTALRALRAALRSNDKEGKRTAQGHMFSADVSVGRAIIVAKDFA